MTLEQRPGWKSYEGILASFQMAKARTEQPVVSESIVARPKRSLFAVLFSRSSPQPTTTSSLPPPDPQEKIAQLESNFKHQLYSDRKLLICHLVTNKANPSEQEKIIGEYLDSPELINDAKTFGQFLSFWLLEFFQQVDTDNLGNLLNFIQTSDLSSLPRDLQRAKKDVFDPIFKLLNSDTPNLAKRSRKRGISEIGFEMANTIINKEAVIPTPTLNEYRKYVETVVCLEADIKSKVQEQSLNVKISKRHHTLPTGNTIKTEEVPRPKEQDSPFCHLYLVTGENFPTPITCPEDFESQIANQKIHFGNVPFENVWAKLFKLTQMTPLEISVHYHDKVSGGNYYNWTQIHIGSTLMRIIFKVEPKHKRILFKIGHRETIYETKRRRGKDKSRSL